MRNAKNLFTIEILPLPPARSKRKCNSVGVWIRKVDERVTNVAAIFKVHSKIEEVKFAIVSLVQHFHQHFLLPYYHTPLSHPQTCVYLFGMLRIMKVVRLSTPFKILSKFTSQCADVALILLSEVVVDGLKSRDGETSFNVDHAFDSLDVE